jgi:hypothetical protein
MIHGEPKCKLYGNLDAEFETANPQYIAEILLYISTIKIYQ